MVASSVIYNKPLLTMPGFLLRLWLRVGPLGGLRTGASH